MKKIILILFCLFMVTGCFDYRELNDINIINSIGVDYVNDEYVVYFETIKNKKSESAANISTSIVKAQDKVFAKAINKAINNAGKSVYLKHVKLLIIGEDLAEKGISDIVDYLVREISLSTSFFTIVAKEPKKILKASNNGDAISNIIVDTIKSNMDADTLDNIDIIASNLYNDKLDITLPYVKISGKNVDLENIGYFKKDKMMGQYNNRIFNFLMLKSKNIEFENKGNILSIYDKKITYKVKKEKIIINVSGLGKVKKINEDIDLKKKESYEELEEEINKAIYDEIKEFIEVTRNDEADVLGFRNLYYKKYQKNINNINYEINTNIKISKNGAIYEVIHD